LHKSARQLAAVNAWIDALARIDDHIHATHFEIPGESVDLDFGSSDSVGEVKERRASAGVAVVGDSWSGIEATFAEIDPRFVRLNYKFPKSNALFGTKRINDHAVLETKLHRSRRKPGLWIGQ
jgi:hypothetical protein